MELTLSYQTHMHSDCSAMNTMLTQTCEVYTKALEFIAEICEKEWDDLQKLSSEDGAKAVVNYVEAITHGSAKSVDIRYNFDAAFPNFPSYLRRAVIQNAFGAVRVFHSNTKNWINGGKKGDAPAFPSFRYELPPFYYSNMFNFTDAHGKKLPSDELSDYAQIKVFCSQRQLSQDRKLTSREKTKIYKGKLDPHKFVWDWMPVRLKHSDVEYLRRMQASGRKILVPVLRKSGPVYSPQFATSFKQTLKDVPLSERVIVAVDLGVNTPATCCVMKSDGTILARRFYKQEADMGLLAHRTNRVSRAQKHGSVKTPTLWRMADNVNRKLSDGTASFIIALAEEFDAYAIVFEHLDLSGKKRGSKKKRLHHWRAKYVQELVSHRAHARGIHVSHICAWGTSRLAYDGSGTVERNVNGNYSVCKFKNGKIYNCDLSASYNIGARYLIREFSKTMPATAWSELVAKVPELSKRTTCTLSSLIRLNAEISPKGRCYAGNAA